LPPEGISMDEFTQEHRVTSVGQMISLAIITDDRTWVNETGQAQHRPQK